MAATFKGRAKKALFSKEQLILPLEWLIYATNIVGKYIIGHFTAFAPSCKMTRTTKRSRCWSYYIFTYFSGYNLGNLV